VLTIIAALNTGLSGGAIQRLSDPQWWTLAALISRWLDLNEGSDILAFAHALGRLSRPELIGSIILLIAAGQLKMEIALPDGVLSGDELAGEARFELQITAVESPPECTTDTEDELRQVIFSKLDLFESAMRASAGWQTL
jgi:hypothetical protein